MRELTLLLVLSLLFLAPAIAQSPTATINGIVLDPSGAAIAGAQIVVVNDATGVQYTARANGEGIYAVPNLPPGPYRIQVSNSGFKTIIKPDIVIHVQDALAINFTLPIGATSEVVTVQGGAPLVNTESGSVGTVVSREFVENMPLNGRSFQDLILLTPGVVTNSPQNNQGLGAQGEFSVNGQRTESNYYTVDGVSANVGIAPGYAIGPATGGGLPGATALGTTQALVSVDALQEFRVQSSTYSAEYGRSPGGQFSFVTRSGTNQWHGSVFDYLRNNDFDANNWFNDFYGLPEPALRQNDFGATLGGPAEIPYLYHGRNKTFFFFSYEGLRLVQPQEASTSYVPTIQLRQSTPSPLRSVLNAFPLPHCPVSGANCTTDLGNGLGDFVGTWSNPSSIDGYSVRIDHTVASRANLFFRFADTSSHAGQRFNGLLNGAPSSLTATAFVQRTYTVGFSDSFSKNFANTLRLNYSTNASTRGSSLDNFGGAIPANLVQLQGLSSSASPYAQAIVNLSLGDFGTSIAQFVAAGKQKQWSVTDTFSVSVGRHSRQFGVDYRRLTPAVSPANPVTFYAYFSASSVQANGVDFGFGKSNVAAYPIYSNFSAFGQDEWRVAPRLTLSLGVRWEVNPAPGATKGNLPYTLQSGFDVNDPGTWKLAPYGTPLWKTGWFNFAPRLGVAYVLRDVPNYRTVIRGGAGAFYDTGQQLGSQGYQGPGFNSVDTFGTLFGRPASFPVPPAEAAPVIVQPPIQPYSAVYGFYPHLQLPYTLQYNTTVEQELGKSQALTISYVGAIGRRLLQYDDILASQLNPSFTTISFIRNGLTSHFDSLQTQFQRRLSHKFQALASYTFSHCIDYGSTNFSVPYQRGNCNFDVRHNFSSALTYDLPSPSQNRIARTVLGHWGIDNRFTARTGFPVTLDGFGILDPGTGQQFQSGLSLVPGQPLYLYGAQYPGRRAINPGAFAPPPGCSPFDCPPGVAPGNAPRNFVRGFGVWQMDVAVRREFPIHEGLKLQFRAEAFNVFNHPNFGYIDPNYCSPGPGCTFGLAQQTLAQSLGVLSPLYQMGGPRSMQFALKLMF